jgi:hypothetical protein
VLVCRNGVNAHFSIAFYIVLFSSARPTNSNVTHVSVRCTKLAQNVSLERWTKQKLLHRACYNVLLRHPVKDFVYWISSDVEVLRRTSCSSLESIVGGSNVVASTA